MKTVIILDCKKCGAHAEFDYYAVHDCRPDCPTPLYEQYKEYNKWIKRSYGDLCPTCSDAYESIRSKLLDTLIADYFGEEALR